jgi:hypothetical protein
MSHWAQLDVHNVVVQVAVGDNSQPDEGEHFFKNVLGGTWVKTSINTHGGIHYSQDLDADGNKIPSEDQSKALRKNYATIGGSYSPELDAFIPIKDFDSWVLNEETCLWEAPVPFPGGNHIWEEESLSWVRGPQPFPSWTWNSETLFWEAPSPKPESGSYFWDESSVSWLEAPPVPE